jgi:hypothetical protein
VVEEQARPHEDAQWMVKWRVDKYEGNWSGDDIDAGLAPTPYEVIEGEHNLLTYGGASILWEALIGNAITAYDNTNARIGVGDGNGSVPTPAATNTDLTAPTNKVRQAMDSTYPTHTDGTSSATNAKVTFRATFAAGTGTFAWREWCIVNHATAGRMLNHRGQDLGTKGAGVSWTFTVEITLA